VCGLVALDLGLVDLPHLAPAVRPVDVTAVKVGAPAASGGLVAGPEELTDPADGDPQS
jgi:hypothetical protein